MATTPLIVFGVFGGNSQGDCAAERMADQDRLPEPQLVDRFRDCERYPADRVVGLGRAVTGAMTGQVDRGDPVPVDQIAEDHLPRALRAAEAMQEDQGRAVAFTRKQDTELTAVVECDSLLARSRIGAGFGCRSLDVLARDRGRRDRSPRHSRGRYRAPGRGDEQQGRR